MTRQQLLMVIDSLKRCRDAAASGNAAAFDEAIKVIEDADPLPKPYICPSCDYADVQLLWLEWRAVPVVGHTSTHVIVNYDASEHDDAGTGNEALSCTGVPADHADLEHYRCGFCDHRWTETRPHKQKED